MASASPPRQQSPAKREERQESPILPPHPLEEAKPLPQHSQPPPEMAVEPQNPEPQSRSRAQVKTPEPRASKERMNGQRDLVERSPSTPGHLAPFDWDEFEARYEQALADADRDEQRLLEEFDQLVKYFNIWASAASVHDNERANKRLQTRERFVKIAEQSLQQKKLHLGEVVRAFQSALALLSQS